MLLNETNTRPATVKELVEGDWFISPEDPNLDSQGASHGYRANELQGHRRPNFRRIIGSGFSMGLPKDKPILIWTGGPVQGSPVNGKYPRS